MIIKPNDPYSPEWLEFWKANPELHRGVGAEAAAESSESATEKSGGDDSGVDKADPDSGSDKGTDKGNLSDDDLKSATSLLDGDWHSDLPEDLQGPAKRFASKADAVRAIVALQKREGQVRVPGKDAKPEEIAAYHKAIGIPEKPEAYEFPDLPEGMEVTDRVMESRAEWSKRFHELGVPKETAKELSRLVNEDAVRDLEAIKQADKEFMEQQESALRKEWKGDAYERNKTLANNAFREISAKVGLNIEDLTKIETKDGRFLMDRADIVRMFAAIGAEMAEGSLGPTLTESEKDSMDDQIRNVRAQQQEAQAAGDSKRANKLYQQEQALLAKRDGNKPIVGARGRMV